MKCNTSSLTVFYSQWIHQVINQFRKPPRGEKIIQELQFRIKIYNLIWPKVFKQVIPKILSTILHSPIFRFPLLTLLSGRSSNDKSVIFWVYFIFIFYLFMWISFFVFLLIEKFGVFLCLYVKLLIRSFN